MKNKNIIRIGILAIFALGLSACTTNSRFGEPEFAQQTLNGDVPDRLIKDGTIRVGAVLPLDTAEGRAIKSAIELAVGNNQGANILLFTQSSGNGRSPGAARQAARELLSKGVEIIIGPLRATNVRSVGIEARGAGVPVIAFSQDINVAGNGVYLQTILREEEINRVVAHSASQGFTKFASFTPKNTFGRVVAASFRSAAGRHGALVAKGSYQVLTSSSSKAQKLQFINDVKSFVKQAQSAKANAILLPAGPSVNKQITTIMNGVGYKTTGVKFLGTGLWNKTSTNNISMLSGGWFANAKPIYSFNAKYAEYTGKNPTSNRPALAYDALSLIAQLGRQASTGMRFTPAAFSNPGGYRGVLGSYRYTGRGVSSYSLSVQQAGGGGFKQVGSSSIAAN